MERGSTLRCDTRATLVRMAHEVSIRELRNNTAGVVAAVQAGEDIVLTTNHRPVADIVPHTPRRSSWLPASALRNIVNEAPADPGLLDDISAVRQALVEA